MKIAVLLSMGVFIVALAAMTLGVIARDGLDILSFFSLVVVALLSLGFFSALKYGSSDDL